MQFRRDTLGLQKKVEVKEPVVVERVVEVPSKVDELKLLKSISEIIDSKLNSIETVIEELTDKITSRDAEKREYLHTITRDNMGLITEIKSTPKPN